MKNKIAIIMPYFGKFPVWIDLFLYSCSKNHFIDFLFFTDCELPTKRYTNTIFNVISFKDYCQRISKELNIHFNPETPYKLCDMKPFYGVIHKEELEAYDFWGFGDSDLVYGDLSIILNDRYLNRYNLITTHGDRVAGHFTVIKKKSNISEMCLKIPNWRERLESKELFGLDEHDFTKLVFPETVTLLRMYRVLKRTVYSHLKMYDFFKIPNNIRNFCSYVYKKEYYTSELPQKGQTWIYNIETGKILNFRNKEIPYLHYLFFKKTPFWDTDLYWRDGFWQVPDIDFSKANGLILFTNEKVVYIER